MTLASLPEALERFASGEILIVVDGPDRENEGDLTVAAEFADVERINFMVRHACGLVCMPSDGARLDALKIGPMVHPTEATCDTPFAVSIDHHTTSTGISVRDRVATVRGALDPDARPWDFRRPGHIFPLRARDGGVLERPGHTEASVDLCRLAGLPTLAVICEVLSEDGSCSRLGDLEGFAAKHGLAIISVDQLIEHRLELESVGARAARP
jgi:3,4-dihydroxy 2-butanone 4-phosphate synthase / GTP cyclohydrolase II